MDDEADLKKIEDVLKFNIEETSDLRCQEFINFVDSDDDDVLDETVADTEACDEFLGFKIDISLFYKYNPISSLKSEEKVVIDSCKDVELKKILILNRKKNIELIQLYKKLKDMLIECKQNIVEKNEIVKQYYAAHKTQSLSSGSWRVGSPYFKDKLFFAAPLNNDSLRKKRNQELNFYDLMPLIKWKSYDCDRLFGAVKLNYNINQRTKIKKNIKLLRDLDEKDRETDIEELELQLKKFSDDENMAVPPLGSDENLNWIRIAEVFVKDKHSDFECQSMWHMMLHPEINKTQWSESETKKLLQLVKKYKCQNWVAIAQELGTNRTCLSVSLRFFSNYYNTYKKGEFTVVEDKKLLDLVNEYRLGDYIPWVRIARHFKNRSRVQLHHRFTYYLNQFDKKRGKFTDAEDVLIMLCVKKYGRNYQKFSEHLPERSSSQIKTRYSMALKNVTKKGTWTCEEDTLMVEFFEKNGPAWTQLATKMCRSGNQLRQRYMTVKQYLDTHPGSTVAEVPRRKHLRFDPNKLDALKAIAERLGENPVIPTLRQVEEYLKTELKELPSNKMDLDDIIDEEKEHKLSSQVDDLLTEFFWNNSDLDTPKINTDSLSKTVDDVELLLDALKVNLDIPSNFLKCPSLDSMDKRILAELNSRQSRTAEPKSISDLNVALPPTFNTTVGMRTLIVKNFELRTLSNQKIFACVNVPHTIRNRVKDDVVKEYELVGEENKKKIQMHKNLFVRRFLSLFKWPAVLTLEHPSKELMSVTENLEVVSRPALKRTYSKRNNNDADNSKSKVRILEDDIKKSLKLTPVTDNSIIMNLVEDKERKLFCMDKVKCGDQTKTVIQEVDLNFLPSRKYKRNQNTSTRCSVNEAESGQSKTVNASSTESLKSEAVCSQKLSNNERDTDNIDITDTHHVDTTDILESTDDLMDVYKLTAFIKSEGR